jgi:hypothetical protein
VAHVDAYSARSDPAQKTDMPYFPLLAALQLQIIRLHQMSCKALVACRLLLARLLTHVHNLMSQRSKPGVRPLRRAAAAAAALGRQQQLTVSQRTACISRLSCCRRTHHLNIAAFRELSSLCMRAMAPTSARRSSTTWKHSTVVWQKHCIVPTLSTDSIHSLLCPQQ